MSDLRVYGKNTAVARKGPEGGWMAARGLSDGTIVQVPWVQALVIEGYGYDASFGAAALDDTDPGTFGAGGIDFTEHDLLVTLPAGNTVGVLPIYFKPIFEAIGTIAAVDVLLARGAAGVISNGISVTPKNLRQDSTLTSVCTVGGLGDAGGTAFVPDAYVYREGGTHLTGVAATGQTLMPEWSIARSGFAPIARGASKQLAGFASAQASTGYILFQYIEMPDEYWD